jgi:actin-related protein 4
VITSSGDKLYGENAIHLPRAGAEIANPYNADGIVEDWETAARLWEYSITSRLTGPRQTVPSKNGLNQRTDQEKKDDDGDVNMEAEMEDTEEQERILSENPLLMTEPGWNPAKAREKTIELAMEDWHVPAFFLAKTGQLAA